MHFKTCNIHAANANGTAQFASQLMPLHIVLNFGDFAFGEP